MPFQDLQEIFQFSITPGQIILNLFVALISGFLISLFYRWTYNGAGYSSRFVHSLILITMITSIIILVIGNNLARAFGLVGAMSIIRFRTAVKDTHDIVFIFFALATGLAAGVGLHNITLIGVIFIGTVQYIMYLLDYGSSKKKQFLLQFSYKSVSEDNPPYLDIMKQLCKQHKLINVRSLGRDDLLEISYYVIFKDKVKSSSLVKKLGAVTDVTNINLFFDNGAE